MKNRFPTDESLCKEAHGFRCFGGRRFRCGPQNSDAGTPSDWHGYPDHPRGGRWPGGARPVGGASNRSGPQRHQHAEDGRSPAIGLAESIPSVATHTGRDDHHRGSRREPNVRNRNLKTRFPWSHLCRRRQLSTMSWKAPATLEETSSSATETAAITRRHAENTRSVSGLMTEAAHRVEDTNHNLEERA